MSTLMLPLKKPLQSVWSLTSLLNPKCTSGLALVSVNKNHTDFKSHLKNCLELKVWELKKLGFSVRSEALKTTTMSPKLTIMLERRSSLKEIRHLEMESTPMLTGWPINLLVTGPNFQT